MSDSETVGVKEKNLRDKNGMGSRIFYSSSHIKLNDNSTKGQPFIFQCNRDIGSNGTNLQISRNRVEDVLLFVAFYAIFFSFLFGFFILLLKGAIDTDDNHTLLWTFFFFGVLFSVIVGGAVTLGVQQAQKEKEREEIENLRKKKTFQEIDEVC